MTKAVENYFSPATNLTNKLRESFSDCTSITDLVTRFVITFGVTLMVGGLYLVLTDASHGIQTISEINSVLSVVEWMPGIPFYIGDLSKNGATTIGLVSWFVGLDLLLAGLGLWVRHKLARFTLLTMFSLSACFQFFQFLQSGIIGSPPSVVVLCADGILVYFLLLKFDSQIGLKNNLTAKIPVEESSLSN